MKNKVVILSLVVMVIIGVILVLINPFKATQSSFVPSGDLPTNTAQSSEVGQKLASFELEDFNGNKVNIASSSSKPIFIDFWAAWCPFCVEEMPEIEKIHQEFKDKIIVLGIHRSETENVTKGTEFAKERGVTYPLLKDSTGEVYRKLTGGRNFMPYALYIDKDGKIVKVKAGPKTAEEMREAIEELLNND